MVLELSNLLLFSSTFTCISRASDWERGSWQVRMVRITVISVCLLLFNVACMCARNLRRSIRRYEFPRPFWFGDHLCLVIGYLLLFYSQWRDSRRPWFPLIQDSSDNYLMISWFIPFSAISQATNMAAD